MVNISGEPALLFTRRSRRLREQGGAVSFPGGGVEREDTSLVDTALREAWEEVGLTRKNVDVWTVMDPIPGRVLTGPTLITPVVAEIHQDLKELVINTREVEEVFTVPLARLADPAYHGYTQFRPSQELSTGFSLPVYWGGRHKVWGLTALICCNFLNILLDHYSHHLNIQTL